MQDLFHGGRTEANDDDHGETYATTIDGPNLYQTIDLPVGQYVISAYLFNDDAHSGSWNRQRDYLVQLASTPKLTRAITRIGWHEKRHIQPAGVFSRSRPMAISRCENFAGGVYKRFFVRVAPAGVRYRGLEMGCITICIRRNYSLNAICEGLFIDRLGRLPFIWYGRVPLGVPEQPPMTVHCQEPVPAFKKGQPYIPADSGFIHPQPNETVMPPPRIPHSCYEAGAIIQQLLHLRRASAPCFAVVSPAVNVALGRFVVHAHVNGKPLGAYFYFHYREAIWNPRFFASLLRDVPLQTTADDIIRHLPDWWRVVVCFFWYKNTLEPKIPSW